MLKANIPVPTNKRSDLMTSTIGGQLDKQKIFRMLDNVKTLIDQVGLLEFWPEYPVNLGFLHAPASAKRNFVVVSSYRRRLPTKHLVNIIRIVSYHILALHKKLPLQRLLSVIMSLNFAGLNRARLRWKLNVQISTSIDPTFKRSSDVQKAGRM